MGPPEKYCVWYGRAETAAVFSVSSLLVACGALGHHGVAKLSPTLGVCFLLLLFAASVASAASAVLFEYKGDKAKYERAKRLIEACMREAARRGPGDPPSRAAED